MNQDNKDNLGKMPVLFESINGVEVAILGTAHVSKQSVLDVENLMKQIQPDCVCIELCEARYEKIQDSERWKKLNLFEVIKSRKLPLLISSIFLSSFQKKIGERMEVKPGSEMMKAIELAKKDNRMLEFVDRDIQLTLKRAWRFVGYFSKMFLFSELLTSLVVNEKLEEDSIEKLKERDILEALFDNLPMQLSKMKFAIVDERDYFMAQKIQHIIRDNPNIKKIMLVIGIGHQNGVQKSLHRKFEQEYSISSLEHLKKIPVYRSILKFMFPIIIIMGFFYYFSDGLDLQKIGEYLLVWVALKSSISGFFALICGGHFLSILGAILTAPISNFNPFLKPGWTAALIESYLRKPKVEDFESIGDDITSFKTFWSNGVLRIFSLFIFPQLGSSIATSLALWYIASQ